MKINRPIIFLTFLLVVVLVYSCASAPERIPLPEDFEGMAMIPGMSEKIRLWGDEPSPFTKELKTRSTEELKKAYGNIVGSEHNYLAISGGGQNGAFGAGLIVGWTVAGTRPEFTSVTGISTGALCAPFAFLGPAYDAQLKEIYTTYSTGDLVKSRPILSAITSDAAVSAEPLKALIAKYFNQKIIDALAAEWRKGRSLLIGTTDLDAKRPVIWNITRIAASGDPKATKLIRKVLLASAAIPVAFPPVMFEVEVDGQRYDEMHADGGTSAQIFLYPVGLRWEEIAEKLAVKGTPKVYLIRNAKVVPDRKAVKPQVFSIAERSISSLIRTQGIGDMYRMYLGARRDGINYHLAYIPDDFKEKEEEMFDPVFMRKLFNLGYEMAKAGYPWAKAPPGFDSP